MNRGVNRRLNLHIDWNIVCSVDNMGAVGKYFKKEFQVRRLYLEHDDASDFYLSCWQRNRTTLPLLCIKAVLFVGCLAIMVTSVVMMAMSLWLIYLTHWGLVINTIATGFSLAVSVVAYKKGPIDATFGLPWYVKAYWVLYNVSVTLALFITIYYWSLFGAIVAEEAILNPVLDVFIHAINSVLMLILLFCSRHPTYLLHFYIPVIAGLVYMLFSLIYYFAGGRDPFGNRYIYPTLNWANPGQTTVMVVISAIGIIIVFIIVVALTGLRNFVTRKFRRDADSINIS